MECRTCSIDAFEGAFLICFHVFQAGKSQRGLEDSAPSRDVNRRHEIDSPSQPPSIGEVSNALEPSKTDLSMKISESSAAADPQSAYALPLPTTVIHRRSFFDIPQIDSPGSDFASGISVTGGEDDKVYVSKNRWPQQFHNEAFQREDLRKNTSKNFARDFTMSGDDSATDNENTSLSYFFEASLDRILKLVDNNERSIWISSIFS
jgi:hypothetical protein